MQAYSKFSNKYVQKNLYMLGALKKGFKAGCRPIIGLDGTHLKTSRGGVILCAVGIDGNNMMFHIAYAMVLKLNRKSWEWFVSLLIEDLNMRNSYAWAIISDKQKELIGAIEDLFPHSEHRFCLRHMYNNFKQKHKGLHSKDSLWRAASATRIADFNKEMEKLKACDSAAYDWVRERPPMNWAKSHFSTWPKCDMLLNNLCESFNHVILKARDKPIITMLEIIRVIMMKMIHIQRDKVLKCNGEICPLVQKILEKNKKKVQEYILEWNGHDKFEVKGWLGDQWTVDLTSKNCSCRKWDITGIPCVHATTCIFYRRESVENYVEHWYRKDTFLKSYAHMLNPLKVSKEWPASTIAPLVPWHEKPKKVGRPLKHDRRKEPDEVNKKKMKYSCSKCGKLGHNKKGCKEISMEHQSAGCAAQSKRSKLSVKRNNENINFVTTIFENLPQGSSFGHVPQSVGDSTITRFCD